VASTRDMYQEITERVLRQMEDGTVPWRIPFNTSTGLHCNFQSKRPYRGINQMLLAMSGFSEPYWMTFKGMREAGGTLREATADGASVRFDEDDGTWHQCMTTVVFWKRIDVKCKDGGCPKCLARQGKGRGKHTIMFLRHYNVLNIEQTTLEPPPRPEPDPDLTPDVLGDSVWNRYVGADDGPAVSSIPGRAYYAAAHDRVNVPVLSEFRSVESYYGTAFHELVHSTGHTSRLARKGIMEHGSTFGSEDYSDEELVAEFGAAMLLGFCGLASDDEVGQSAAYIDNWMTRLSEDPKLLVHAAARAQRAADHILGVKFDDEPVKDETVEAVA
jgi:antirestriction protein ArdC